MTILGLLKHYITINFRARKINRDTDKLVRTPILIKKIYLNQKINLKPSLSHQI
jgi:hypothetical protein